MRRFLSSIAAVGLSLLVVSGVHAQNRNFGARTFTMDDGAGHFYTMQAPAGMTGNVTYNMPLPPPGNPPAGFVNVGAAAGQTLFWNSANNDWEASSVITNNTNGNGTGVSITAPLSGVLGSSFSGSGVGNVLTVSNGGAGDALTVTNTGTGKALNATGPVAVNGTLNTTGAATVATGASLNNTFGNGASATNSFGSGGSATNSFGQTATSNAFGSNTPTNFFGTISGNNFNVNNSFGVYSGSGAQVNNLIGQANNAGATVNNFLGGGTGSSTTTINGTSLVVNAPATVNAAETHAANSVTGSNFTISGGAISNTPISGSTGSFTSLVASSSETFSNLNTAGIVHNSATGALSTGPVNLALNGAGGDVSGVLPIADGGTGAATVGSNNLVFAGPASGAPGAPGFRTLVASDIPGGSTNYIQNQNASPQSGANFWISGNGQVSGTLTAGNSITTTGGSLAIPSTSNSAVGDILQGGAPLLHTFGPLNVFLGYNAGNFSLSNGQNVGLGASSMAGLTSGFQNTAVGYASFNQLQTGSNNVAIGTVAFNAVTSASASTAVGAFAGNGTTVNTFNTFIGYGATGGNNLFFVTSLGASANAGATDATALGANTSASGVNSTAVGFGAAVASNNTIQLGNNSVTAVNTNGLITSNGLNLNNTTSPLQMNGAAGAPGNVLVSGGGATTPTWRNLNATDIANAGTLTNNTSGNAAGFTGTLSGDVTGTQGATAINTTAAAGNHIVSAINNATTNIANPNITAQFSTISIANAGSGMFGNSPLTTLNISNSGIGKALNVSAGQTNVQDLTATGAINLNANNAGSGVTNIGTHSSAGNVTIGNGTATTAISSANWGVTAAGAANFATLGASTSETFSNLSTAGVVHNNTAGTLSTGPVNLASNGAGGDVSGIVAIANGGTGSNTQNFVDLSTNQSVGGNKTFTGTTTTTASLNASGGISIGNGGTISREIKPGGLSVAGTVVGANSLQQIIISGPGFANLNLNDAVTVEFDNASPASAGLIWSAAVTASNGGTGTVTINVFNPTGTPYTFPATTPFYTIFHQ